MVSAHLISRHLMELREHADNNPSLFVAGEVDAQIAYNETRQIVSVRLLRLRNVRPRLDHRQELNVSVGVRVMPTKAAEQRTKTYPNKTDLRFKQVHIVYDFHLYAYELMSKFRTVAHWHRNYLNVSAEQETRLRRPHEV